MLRAILILALLPLPFLASCAKVTVRKVPQPWMYEGKNPEDQRMRNRIRKKADAMEGFRYYLPRAYLAVKKRFPIDTETFLVNGKVTGGYFVSDDIANPAALGLAPGTKKIAVPLSQLVPPEPPGRGSAARSVGQSVPLEQEGSKAPSADEGSPPGGGEEKKEGPKKEGEKKEGEKKEKGSTGEEGKGGTEGQESSTTSGGAVALSGGKAELQSMIPAAVSPKLDVSEFYDVIFLPDYTEQYVIDARAYLGKANADLGLRFGWMLETARMAEDNTEFARFLFTEIQEFTKLARRAVELKIAPESVVAEALGGATSSPPGAGTPASQSVALVAVKQQEATIRLVVVRFANVGIHPFLKPWEYEEETARLAKRRASRVSESSDLLIHNFPVKYSYSTEVYGELLAPRPAPPQRDSSNISSGAQPNPAPAPLPRAGAQKKPPIPQKKRSPAPGPASPLPQRDPANTSSGAKPNPAPAPLLESGTEKKPPKPQEERPQGGRSSSGR